MMDDTIFHCTRNNGFPTGLRVLVVDDDLTWLKILEKMLKKCFYEVTTSCLAREALSILRERKDGFDIVISDVNMPDMDGFKLLELVGLEMDLPVIMMSVDGETSRVMKGVQHGACDYLLKPIRMKELRNIWQHVLRKRMNDVQNYDEVVQMMRAGSSTQSQCDAGYYNLTETSTSSTRKRKDVLDSKHIGSTDQTGDASAKRARVVWTVDLHQKFVKAVKLIGMEKIGPKKILDSMNVPWLTRENVASHLQKYRLYLSRLQRDNPFEISNHLDVDPEETHRNKHIDADKEASSSKMYYNGGLYHLNTSGPEPVTDQEPIQSHKNRFERPEYSELALVAFGKDYKTEWDQSDEGSVPYLYDYNETDLMASVPVHIFDALRYDWCGEVAGSGCPILMDQTLSILDTAHFSSSYYPVS